MMFTNYDEALLYAERHEHYSIQIMTDFIYVMTW